MGPKLPRTGKKPGKPDDTGGVLVGEDRGYRRLSQPHTSTAIAMRMHANGLARDSFEDAGMAQLAERLLAMHKVAGSSPVARSYLNATLLLE